MVEKAAYYTNMGKYDNLVTIYALADGRRHFLAEHRVEDKRIARNVAAQYNAKPYNF